jgi:biotin carboxyl carrier protein
VATGIAGGQDTEGAREVALAMVENNAPIEYGQELFVIRPKK